MTRELAKLGYAQEDLATQLHVLFSYRLQSGLLRVSLREWMSDDLKNL